MLSLGEVQNTSVTNKILPIDWGAMQSIESTSSIGKATTVRLALKHPNTVTKQFLDLQLQFTALPLELEMVQFQSIRAKLTSSTCMYLTNDVWYASTVFNNMDAAGQTGSSIWQV